MSVGKPHHPHGGSQVSSGFSLATVPHMSFEFHYKSLHHASHENFILLSLPPSPITEFTLKYLDWLSNPTSPSRVLYNSREAGRQSGSPELCINTNNDSKPQIPPFIIQGRTITVIFQSEKLQWFLCACLSAIETWPPNWTKEFSGRKSSKWAHELVGTKRSNSREEWWWVLINTGIAKMSLVLS